MICGCGLRSSQERADFGPKAAAWVNEGYPVHRPHFWYLDAQRADGSWELAALPECDARAVPGGSGEEAATASWLLLAWIGGSKLHEEHPLHPVAHSSLRWLLTIQDDNGRFAHTTRFSARDQALACAALGDWKLFGYDEAERAVEGAARHILVTRRKEGGWALDGSSEGELDPLTTIWSVLALRSARDAVAFDTEGGNPRARGAVRRELESSAVEQALPSSATEARRLDLELCELVLRSLDPAASATGHSVLDRFDVLSRAQRSSPLDLERFFLAGIASYRAGGAPFEAWCRRFRDLQREVDPPDSSSPLEAPLPYAACWAPGGSLGAHALYHACLLIHFRFGRGVGMR